MRRREFLLAAGTASTVGVVWDSTRRPGETLRVRVWFTDRAAAHAGLRGRIRGYLEEALAPAWGGVDISFGGVVPVEGEQGRTLMAVEWPRLVAQGVVGLGPVDPVGDVNLLVTDGDPSIEPAGYGMSNVATITGARHLAAARPRTAVDDTLPYTTEGVVAQLLLHETGHALGLRHEHGNVTIAGDSAVASPMVGGYAWADGTAHTEATSGCGRSLTGAAAERRLGLDYTVCAREALRSYSGGVVP